MFMNIQFVFRNFFAAWLANGSSRGWNSVEETREVKTMQELNAFVHIFRTESSNNDASPKNITYQFILFADENVGQ